MGYTEKKGRKKNGNTVSGKSKHVKYITLNIFYGPSSQIKKGRLKSNCTFYKTAALSAENSRVCKLKLAKVY